MKSFIIPKDQIGQRFDHYLKRLLPGAPLSFLYKMLRKKNIVLNDSKAEGNERLTQGDQVTIYFSNETYEKFSTMQEDSQNFAEHQQLQQLAKEAYETFQKIPIVYEDADVLIVDKPSGILTQKALPTDKTLNEWLIGYLLTTHTITEQELQTFHPSVCNRLDRNTSGLVLCGKTLLGSRELGRLIKNRQVQKYYRAIVHGQIHESQELHAYILKDPVTNQVTIYEDPKDAGYQKVSRIHTSYKPVTILHAATEIEIRLHTGKTHQIRAHLASQGHPLIGDYKYGDTAQNEYYRKHFGVRDQLLCAYRLEFPALEGALSGLSKRTICATLPYVFKKVIYVPTKP
ncbi:MAG: RluA family pseudouridine synthase [Clostridium sp.]|jgi:23S rRNA pseudouridine955/2504/2580 synthase|nr:RluA family pseudouridine synthase [Clostridium sp.]